MTSAHILYIPTIFLLGFLTGSLFGKGSNISAEASQGHPKTSAIDGKILFGSFVIFAIVFIGTHFFELPQSSKAVTKALNGLEIFDKKPSYNTDEVYLRIEQFPEYGRQLYKRFTYTIDVLFPITLFTFLFLLSRFTINRFRLPKLSQIGLQVLPIVWIGTDFIENAVIFNLLDQYPTKNQFLAGSLGYITIIKFTLLLLSILSPTAVIFLNNFRKRVNVNSQLTRPN